MSSYDPKVGIIGLGRMGGNIAQNLIEAGHHVTGLDLREDAVTEFVAAGGEESESVESVAAGRDVVITSLPDPSSVKEIYLGDTGLIESADTSTVLVEMSTIDPDTILEIADAAEHRDISVLGAPVSGGPEEAYNGTLSLMVGGERSSLENDLVQSVLHQIGDDVHYVGDVDAGYAVKLINNTMSLSNLLILVEALSLGAARGIDSETILEVVRTSGGSSNQLLKRGPMILNRDFEAGFPVDLGKKDMSLVLDTADKMGQPMIATSLIHSLYTQLSLDGYGDEDISAITKLYEHNRGVTLEADETVDYEFTGY